MVIDVNACVGCYNCVLACKDEHVGNEWPPYSAAQPDTGHFWMKLIEKERVFPQVVRVTYTPIPCMQCKDAPCVKAAKGRAARVRPDGIIVFDPKEANSQRQIMDSCPFGVVYWNDHGNVPDGNGLPQKCTFCAHLLDRGYDRPRCAEACPVDAIIFGDLDDPDSEVSKLVRCGVTETLFPELGIDTAVRYVGLPKPMIGGSVILGDTGECGTDVDVTVLDKSGRASETKTNIYGDFLIEGLRANAAYEIVLSRAGYSQRKVSVILNEDTNLGEIFLKR